jgi:ribosome-binding protein aMBF1 (putative translation factor)
MSGRGGWSESAGAAKVEHPHDTEDLVRLVMVTRHERGLTEAQLARAAGVSEAEVRRFEAEEIVPAEPMAMRFIDAMRLPQQ